MNILRKLRGKESFYALLLAGIAIRVVLLPVESQDMSTFLYRWYDYIVEHGAWTSLGAEFSNYSPPYMYILSLAALSIGWLPKLIAIKSFSILFDFVNAFLIYRIVKLHQRNEIALLAPVIFLCLPTIFLNSSAWGQSDGMYACFVLACLFFVLKEKFLPAILFFGIAFSFKAQAAFIIPFLFLLTLKKRIPWYYYFLVPVVYLVMMIPALLAGRTLSGVLGIFLNQADYYKDLSKNAPNLYLFISNEYYSSAVVIGLTLTVVLTILWSVGYAIKIKHFERELMMLCATVSVAAVPFFLPKMHERYFYLMEVFTLLLAFFIPNTWFAVLGAQVVSLITYYVYLVLNSQTSLSVPIPLYLGFSSAVNLFLIGYLLWKQYNFIQNQVESA